MRFQTPASRVSFWKSVLVICAAAAVAESVHGPTIARADFVAPTTWARGTDAASTYQEWDVFSSTAGPNAPNSPGAPPTAVVAAAPFNPNGAANVLDSSGASILTSGGNIYSPTGVVLATATVPNYGASQAQWTTLILQTRTLGTPLDPDSVHVQIGDIAVVPVASTLLLRQALGGFGGTLEDQWFQFHLPGNAASYDVSFSAAGSSTSLDKVSIDTVWTASSEAITEPTPVPEPASVVLAGLALMGIAARRLASQWKVN